MFVCKQCVIPSARWKFDIPMSLSLGTCEVCKTKSPCIDGPRTIVNMESAMNGKPVGEKE